MGEPISSGAGLAGVAGHYVGTGLAAAALAALGVHPQPLFWALVGATLGMSLAPSAGRVRAFAVFVCVVLASALLGTQAAQAYANASLLAASSGALLTGMFFHPLVIAAMNAAPAFVSGWAQRLGASNGNGSSPPVAPPPPSPPPQEEPKP